MHSCREFGRISRRFADASLIGWTQSRVNVSALARFVFHLLMLALYYRPLMDANWQNQPLRINQRFFHSLYRRRYIR